MLRPTVSRPVSSGTRTGDLPACSIVPQPTTLQRVPFFIYKLRGFLVCERTIATERPQPASEVSANFSYITLLGPHRKSIVEVRLLNDCIATVAARTYRKQVMCFLASDFIGALTVA
jgi:hypothetical protein